jgi:hypothetical protein
MVEDLKADSANYERSVASGTSRGSPYLEEPIFGYHLPNKAIGSYADSVVHQSRQHWGPSAGAAAAAATPAASQYTGSSYSGASYSEQPPPQQQQQHYQQQQPQSYGQSAAGYTQQQQYQQQQSAYPTPSASSVTSGSSTVGNSASPISYSHSAYTTERPQQPNQSSYGTTPAAGYSATPRNAHQQQQQQQAYPAGAPSYGQPAPRYFGSLHPEFLVYN